MSRDNRDILLLDGATGTELGRRGISLDMPRWSAGAMESAPDVLQAVHAAYLQAGADAITTNTFRTHERSLAKVGQGNRWSSLTEAAVMIAQLARDSVKPEAMVLGGVAPLEDCYQPDLAPPPEVCRREHGQLIGRMVELGVDLILLETMGAAEEAVAAAEAARELAPATWAISFCLRSSGPAGLLLDGTPLPELLEHFADARFIGLNCVAADTMTSRIAPVRRALPDDLPLAVYANVGHPDEEGGWICTDAVDPVRYAAYAAEWVAAGASIVGGCCGTTPETIRALHERFGTSVRSDP